MEIIKSANGMVYFRDCDGDEKVFKLDINAVADLEALLGKGINALINEENMGFNIVRGFYWAGFKFKYKRMTLEKAGNFVQRQIKNGLEFEKLMEPVIEALVASGIMSRDEVEESEYESEDDGFETTGDEEEAKN